MRAGRAAAGVLAAIGTGVGLLACVVGKDALVAFVPADLYRAGSVEIDARIAAFTAGLMLVTTVLFGVLPAFRGTRLAPGAVMRATAGRTTAGAKR